MILDYNLMMSDDQAIPTPVSADFASTNTLDTEVVDSNLGAGTPLWVVVQMKDKQTGSTAETLAVGLQDCATSGGTYATIALGRTFSGGEFIYAPTLMAIPLPANHKRYLKILYDCNAELVWTGSVSAYLSLNAPKVNPGVRA